MNAASDILYTDSIANIDWPELKRRLAEDDFNNGRTPEQLRESCANSYAVSFAWRDGKVIGTARVLSDGVCNAYLIDVWTYTPFRKRGIAREMIRRLSNAWKVSPFTCKLMKTSQRSTVEWDFAINHKD